MEEKQAGHNRLSGLLVLAVAIGLIGVAAALVWPRPAGASSYTVAECGWYMDHDAVWSETAEGRLVSASYCVPPRSRAAFDGVHMTSQTRGSKPVGGGGYARWRWTAPSDTAIVNVHGSRRQILQDGFEHRLGGVTGSGFNPDFRFTESDSGRDFRTTFRSPVTAFEARLLCTRAESRSCSTGKPSSATVHSLVFTLDDPKPPTVEVSGELIGSGWQRGNRRLEYRAVDRGSGLRFSETTVDGLARIRTEHSCTKVTVGGQTRAGRMRPCGLIAAGSQTLDTPVLGDGPHRLRHCAIDFSGNTGCSATTTILTDNTPPSSPRSVTVQGGDGWHRENGFSLGWELPDQGVAAPVAAAWLRVTSGGFDSGPIDAIATVRSGPVTVPGPGEYPVRVWLGDAAGNAREESAATTVLRFDDVPPTAYLLDPPRRRPERLQAVAADTHSGIGSGVISVRPRRGDENSWRDLPTGLRRTDRGVFLDARLPSPDLGTGTWVVRATAIDRAGNRVATSRRGNGSVLTVETPAKARTRLAAHLIAGGRSGPILHAGFRDRVRVEGRLSAGSGLAGQPVRVIETPSRGSRQRALVRTVRTGPGGYFRLRLRCGGSRRVRVEFTGTARYERTMSDSLRLTVTGRIGLRAGPRRLRTGQTVSFAGRVSRGIARSSPRGSLIAIQYLERASGAWRPVLVTRTDGRGRYRAAYRFRYITGIARIRLRAVLLPSPGFPYGPGASGPVVIRVSG